MIKHVLAMMLLGMFLVVLSSCSDYSKVEASFRGEAVDRGADFTLELLASKQFDMEVFSEVKNTIRLVSYREKVKGIGLMVLPDRKGSRKKITFNRNQPHTMKISAKFFDLPEGQLKLDFGELGYMIIPNSSSFGLGVVVYPASFSYFSENEGIVSNFINVVFENGAVKELSTIID